MNLKKVIQKGKVALVYGFYHLTSKRVMMETARLFASPNMTKYHHIVSALRYVAIEQHYGKNDFGKELYIKANRWESQQQLQEDLDRFAALIKSVETKGYDTKSVIYVDLDGNCINGTHRLALCAHFGIKTIPVLIIPRRLKPNTVEQMKAYYRLSKEDFHLLDEAYQRMRAQLIKE